MKAAIIGSGRIACGFAGHILALAGFRLVFLSRNPDMVAHLNRDGGYRVLLANGRQQVDDAVRGVRALDTADTTACAAALADADLIVTSVGAGNLRDIVPLLARGLKARRRPVNVLAFENLPDGAADLRARLAEAVPGRRFGVAATLISRAVTQRIGEAGGDAPLVFVGDPPSQFVVDGTQLVEPLPVLPSAVVATDFAAWMQRKLFVFSAGHATCAYLGHLKGYRYIHSAIRDEEIRRAVVQAMQEGQRGIAAMYGEDFAGGPEHVEEILSRFENAAIRDSVARVARDPSRKLASGDRLLGAARLASMAGVNPRQLLRAAAAAYCFADPADAVAANLQQEIRAEGLQPTMRRVSGLAPGDRLGRTVARQWRHLTREWHGDSVLLDLRRVHWA